MQAGSEFRSRHCKLPLLQPNIGSALSQARAIRFDPAKPAQTCPYEGTMGTRRAMGGKYTRGTQPMTMP